MIKQFVNVKITIRKKTNIKTLNKKLSNKNKCLEKDISTYFLLFYFFTLSNIS